MMEEEIEEDTEEIEEGIEDQDEDENERVDSMGKVFLKSNKTLLYQIQRNK